MTSTDLPEDVISHLHDVFQECNSRITEKLSRNPNIPEESLDLTWIEHLSRYSSATVLPSHWAIKIDVHYLGGLAHFQRWEIADIGVLLFIRSEGRIQRSKVALLQSKRLYPTTGTVIEEGKTDYETGFARLADPEDLARSIAVEAEYRFTEECRYGALIAGSDQVNAIQRYHEESKLSIYYQLYNPWELPFVQRVPLSGGDSVTRKLSWGVRILPAAQVHAALAEHPPGYRPQASDLTSLVGTEQSPGWSLEHFVTGLFLTCQEGSVFPSIADHRIQRLFYRRTGPIAAAIAITIEAPEGAR